MTISVSRLSAAIIAAMATVAGAVYAQQAPATISPPDSVTADGIAPIPRSIVADVSRYTNFRPATFQDWDPKTRRVLLTTRFGDTNQLHIADHPGGARQQITFLDEPVAEGTFTPAGDALVYSSDVGGGEFFQLYHLDLKTRVSTLLTDGKSRNEGLTWSRKGDRFAYASTRRNGRDNDIYVAGPADPVARHVLALEGQGAFDPLDWSADDRRLLVEEFLSVAESRLWVVDLNGGARQPVAPNRRASYSDAQFAADGKSIYAVTDDESEFLRVVRIDLATGAATPVSARVNWDVEAARLSDDGRTLAYVTNEDGVSVLHVLDVASGADRIASDVPKGVIARLKWHPNNVDIGFSLSSAQSVSDVYSVDAKTLRIERWTRGEGAVDPATFTQPELIHWKSFDGRSISGYLYSPPAKFAGKHPVIINIHGGPEGQSRPTFINRNNYYVNELGIAMIYPNVRGSTGYGKSFLALDNGLKREDSYKDINALFDWIATRPDLDGSRLMVTGGSYGGFMTLAIATHYNDRIACSLSIVGISNLVTFLERTEAYRRDLRRVEYGDERDPQVRAFMERIAAVNNVRNITKPLFVVSGKNDPRVPLNEGQQMVAAARTQQAPVWYLVGNDEGHGFAKKKNQDYLFYATVAFVKQYLLKQPPTDSAQR
jgi:dipeptidyl aminopeptidase/acylaminoacyl peptidase